VTTVDINVVKSGRAAVMPVRGELALSIAPRLSEELVSLAGEHGPEVTVDLADLDFIDTGLQTIVAGLKRSRDQGGDLGLCAAKPGTLRVLEITGLTSVFRLEAIGGAGFIEAISGPGAHSVDQQMTGEHSHGAVD
jgi:anti-sigma B factor antagonist